MVRLNRWTDKVTSSLSSWRHVRAGEVECLPIWSRAYETNELVVAGLVCCGRLIDLMQNIQLLGEMNALSLSASCILKTREWWSELGEGRELWYWGHVAALARRPAERKQQ